MFDKTSNNGIYHTRKKVLVEFITDKDIPVLGEVFLKRDERLVDLLNDEREFIPIEMAEGEVKIVAKKTILQAKIVSTAPAEKRDPYKILKIEETASPEEIRAAWVKRIKTCHPDRMAAMGADEEIVYAARKATQIINAAYDDILRSLKSRHAAAH